MPAARGRVGEPVDQAEYGAGDQQGTRDIEPGLDPGRLPLQQQRAPPMNATPAKIRFTFTTSFFWYLLRPARRLRVAARWLSPSVYAEALRAVLRTVASGEGW